MYVEMLELHTTQKHVRLETTFAQAAMKQN